MICHFSFAGEEKRTSMILATTLGKKERKFSEDRVRDGRTTFEILFM